MKKLCLFLLLVITILTGCDETNRIIAKESTYYKVTDIESSSSEEGYCFVTAIAYEGQEKYSDRYNYTEIVILGICTDYSIGHKITVQNLSTLAKKIPVSTGGQVDIENAPEINIEIVNSNNQDISGWNTWKDAFAVKGKLIGIERDTLPSIMIGDPTTDFFNDSFSLINIFDDDKASNIELIHQNPDTTYSLVFQTDGSVWYNGNKIGTDSILFQKITEFFNKFQ